ncbi:MAG: hypothetical protein WBY47_17290 [Desulfobacterales bacterium]|jgi:hypothetical protein
MKKMMIAAFVSFFLIATATPAISKNSNRDSQGRRDYKAHPNTPPRQNYKAHPNTSPRQNYKNRPGYYNHRGYRARPYDNRRHYGHYDYKGHGYSYHGHWRSWKQWDDYARKHPDIYRHGHYYRENAHLMFRFCEPGTGGCFFFSIGR